MWKRGRQGEALGRSRGGLGTKIHLAVDAAGRPLRFLLTGGHAADSPQAVSLLSGLRATHVIADKGYDSDEVLQYIHQQGKNSVIPPKSNRKLQRRYDRQLYKERNLIEWAVNKLKGWRRIATRYDRRSAYFLAALHLAAAITWST